MKDTKKPLLEASAKLKEAHKKRFGVEGLTTAPANTAHPAPNHEKMGLSTDSTLSATISSPAELSVSILNGDDENLYYLFEARGRQLIRPSKLVVEKRQQVLGDLGRIGILAVSAIDKKRVTECIEVAKIDDNAIVATRVGYERRSIPRYFVYGDGTVINSEAKLRVFSTVEHQDRIAKAGDLKAYEAGIAKVIRDQSVPITLFFYGLTPLVKPFAMGSGYKAENMMFELVGRTSTYKSALTCTLAASAWGKGHSSNGYARDWNMSEQKIEELFLDFNDHLLILDEATLAHSNEKTRADKILNTVHRLSSGQGRARSGVEHRDHSVAMLSTSNQPMHLILPASDDVKRALEVRLISFQLPTASSSFFETTPVGFETVDDAMSHIFKITENNYGLLARAYIQDILQALSQDSEKVRSVLRGALEIFLKKICLESAGTDAVLYRRSQSFALSYATASLAFHLGTLEKKKWGHVKRGIVRAWRQYGNVSKPNGSDPRLVAYMSDTSNCFADARGKKPLLKEKKFKNIAGFIHTGRDKALLLAVPKARLASTGISTAGLKSLKKEGVLRCGENNLQTKLALRHDGNKDQRDVFYVFKISEVPKAICFHEEKKGA